MKQTLFPVALFGLSLSVATAGTLEGKPACKQLVDLYIYLGEQSGEVVSEAAATAEVMSGAPSNADCAAMLALFPKPD